MFSPDLFPVERPRFPEGHDLQQFYEVRQDLRKAKAAEEAEEALADRGGVQKLVDCVRSFLEVVMPKSS